MIPTTPSVFQPAETFGRPTTVSLPAPHGLVTVLAWSSEGSGSAHDNDMPRHAAMAVAIMSVT
jgi:hypothetical protein